jgi:hypothetical protein
MIYEEILCLASELNEESQYILGLREIYLYWPLEQAIHIITIAL